jgi:thiamine biosynthesis lipoprotein
MIMRKKEVTFFALGTVNKIQVRYRDEEEELVSDTLEMIVERITNISEACNFYDEHSEVGLINHFAGERKVHVSHDTLKIIQKGKEYSLKTNGVFDITAGVLTKLWDVNHNEGKVPSPFKVHKAKKLVNVYDLMIEGENVGLKKKGQMIDLGSIAKGYCADLTKHLLLSEGLNDAIINYGGTVITIGRKHRIGIQDPFQRQGEMIGSIEVQNQAVVTSGNYEHFFIKDQKRYSHLLDTRKGRPVDNDIASVTLVTGSALEADVYTTVLFMNTTAYYADELVIMNDGRYYMTENLIKVFCKV